MNLLFFFPLLFAVSYFVLFEIFALFFDRHFERVHIRSFISIGLIAALYYLSLWLAFSIPDGMALFGVSDFGNRIQHALGGGFVTLFMCYRIVRDGRFRTTRLQFVIFSFLIVTVFGVANEVFEFFGQNFTSFLVFADSINDTWLDLISNSAGAGLGILICTPFIGAHRPLSGKRD